MENRSEEVPRPYKESGHDASYSKKVVIVAACRTAIGAFGETLLNTNAVSLASATIKEAVKRIAIDPQLIDDVRSGCRMESADTCNVA